MNPVNPEDLPWTERRSPKGGYHRFSRNLSGAMTAAADGAAPPGPPPFDVGLVRLPPGVANYPFHSHGAEWECYLILAGRGTVRHGDRRSPLRAGDCVLCPPGEPHQLINDGEEDLVYYVIANNAPAGAPT